MLKKAMIGLIILSIGFFIYTTYFKDDTLVYTENFKTTSLDIKYTNGLYILRAKKQVDDAQSKTTNFEDVVLQYENAFLKGDYAVKEASDDIALTGNVVGENPINGWVIKGQEILYHRDLDRFNSTKPVEANNTIKKLSINGNYFESSKDFNEILLDGNVNAVTENFDLVGEKAYFKGDLLELLGNVETEIKSLNKTNSKENSIVGVFPGATYDTKTKELKASGAYQMFYKDFVINAEELVYDENADIITAKGNVTLTGEKLFGNLKEASFNLKEDKIYLVGPVDVTYDSMYFTGENGVYDNGKETFEITGKATLTSGDNLLNADRFFYTQNKSLVEVFGDKEKFTYFGGNREVRGTYAKYYSNKNSIEIPGKFDFKYESSPKEQVDGTGEKLVLNTLTQKGQAINPVLFQNKDKIKGAVGELDFLKGIYKLKGKVLGDYGNYRINTEEVDYFESNQTIVINNPYTIVNKNSKFKIWGNDVKFDTAKYIITTEGKANFENETITAYGTGLNHNLNTGVGEFKKDFSGKIPKSGVQLTGDKVKFKEGEYVTLNQNVNGIHKDFIVNSQIITYNLLLETIVMPQEALISTKDRGMEGKTESGIYDTKTEKYTGHNFKGWSEKATVIGDYIYYDLVKDEAYLKGSVEIKDKITAAEIKSNEITYYIKTDIVASKEVLDIKRDNIFITAKSGKANLSDKTMQLNKTILTTSNKDRISGDTLQANLLKNEFKFDGNIEGTVYSLNQSQLSGIKEIDSANPIQFKGDITKAFFVKNGDNKYMITRNEIINGSEFYYKNIKLQGDYIELDNDSQNVFAKGNSRIELENGNKLSAESITMDMIKDITNLKNNVIITNTSEATGGINTKADKAIFRNKDNLVDLEGNVESYKGKTKLQADKGIYDLTTNKLNGKGNIFLSLDFDTAAQMKEKQKRQKDLNEKIKKAQANSEPPQIVNMDVHQIDLKKLIDGVNIVWKSSNDDYITIDGRIRHPPYTDKDISITLTANYMCEEVSNQKSYTVLVKKSDVKTYLVNQMERELLSVQGDKIVIKSINSGITTKFISSDEKFLDNKGNIKTDDLSKLNGFGIKLVYTLGEVSLTKEYRGSYIDGKLKFISLPF